MYDRLCTLYINVSVEKRIDECNFNKIGVFPSNILIMMKSRALTWILLEMEPVRAVCRTTTGSPGILPWVKTKQRRYDPTRRFRSVMSRMGCTASYWEICNHNTQLYRSKLRLWWDVQDQRKKLWFSRSKQYRSMVFAENNLTKSW